MDAPAPFQTDRNSLVLEAGKSVALVVTLQPPWPGQVAGTLKIHTPDHDVLLPLSADVASRVHLTGSPVGAARLTPNSTSKGSPPDSSDRALMLPSNWSGLPPVGTITVDRLSYETADLSWSPPAKDKLNSALNYRIEVRRIGVEATGSIRVVWIPLPTVDFTKAPNRVQAHLREIPAGIGITLRVISVTPKGGESEPSGALQFFTPSRPVIFTAQRILLALFMLMLIGALWMRHQMNLPLRRE